MYYLVKFPIRSALNKKAFLYGILFTANVECGFLTFLNFSTPTSHEAFFRTRTDDEFTYCMTTDQLVQPVFPSAFFLA